MIRRGREDSGGKHAFSDRIFLPHQLYHLHGGVVVVDDIPLCRCPDQLGEDGLDGIGDLGDDLELGGCR